jgi:hypothetical protein
MWGGPEYVEVHCLPLMGWVRINWVGEENIYFTLGDGTKCFCKVA